MNDNGVPTKYDNTMSNVMQHNYLRKSIEQRVERKKLISNYKDNQKQAFRRAIEKSTKAADLRNELQAQKLVQARDANRYAQYMDVSEASYVEKDSQKIRLRKLIDKNSYASLDSGKRSQSMQNDYKSTPNLYKQVEASKGHIKIR
jgi:hypothetical protein